MNSEDTVSVVIPTYQRQATLGAAVRSALAQTGAQVEVLVCDDGSTDASEAVVRDMGDSRVKWLPGGPSGGPSVPRNRGVAAAEGQWIAFLDSDDTWSHGKIARQLSVMKRGSAQACSTNARVERGSSESGEPLLTALPEFLDVTRLLAGNLVITSSLIAAAPLLRAATPFPVARPDSIFEDYAVWLRLAQLTPIVVLDEQLVNYRRGGTDHFAGQYDLALLCAWNAIRDFWRWRGDQMPPIRASWAERRAVAKHLSGLLAVRQLPQALRRWHTRRST